MFFVYVRNLWYTGRVKGEKRMQFGFLTLAAVCAVVFVVLTLRALWALRRQETPGPAPARETQLRAMAAALAFGVAVELVFVVIALMQSPGVGWGEAVQRFFERYPIDANHYIRIARYGYSADNAAFSNQELMIVFFPLYPLLLRMINPFGSFPWYLCGMLLQLVLFPVGAGLYYRLAYRLLGPERAGWALAFLMALPGSFFFLVPMSDSLLLLLGSAFFLLLLEGRALTAGICGFLAAFCRSPGALLTGAAGALYLSVLLCRKDRFHLRWLLPVLGPIGGLGAYLALNLAVYGDPFRFSFYQASHWGQRLGLFWNTILYHGQNFMIWMNDNPQLAFWLCLWAVGTLVVGLVALIPGRRLPACMQLYGLAYYAFTNGVTWLLSAPRYALNNPAISMGFACLPRGVRYVVWALLAIAWTAFFVAFLQGLPIF